MFFLIVLCGWTLGAVTGGSLFKKKGVRIGLAIASVGGLASLLVEFEKLVG